MKDLRSQLIHAFGEPKPAAPKATGGPPSDALLAPDAHRQSPWWQSALRTQVGTTVVRKADASLPAARQQTDQLLKALKAEGRHREMEALAALRQDFLDRRAKVAWSALKDRIEGLGVSEKLYRSLKQDAAVDPVTALERLADHPDAEIRGMSAKRLKALLGG